jgi:hypothetical protein
VKEDGNAEIRLVFVCLVYYLQRRWFNSGVLELSLKIVWETTYCWELCVKISLKISRDTVFFNFDGAI